MHPAALSLRRYALTARRHASGNPRFVTLTENPTDGSPAIRSCTVISGSHTVVSDVAKAAGGNGLGMSPKELLMSALASCTAMTIRTVYEYNKKKSLGGAPAPALNWEGSTLTGINITVAEHGDHPHVPSKLTVNISLVGNLTPEHKQRLLKVADNCPVKKIITGQTVVESSVQ